MMAKLSQGLGFDLADTLSSNGERLAYLFERQLIAVFQPEAHLNDSFLARRKRFQDGGQVFLQIEMNGGIRWRHDALVLDEVAEMGLFVFSNRRLEGYWLLRNLFCFADRVDGKVHAPCDFLGSRFATTLLD
jgi:hypothetical protein